jgi:aminopeptidase N
MARLALRALAVLTMAAAGAAAQQSAAPRTFAHQPGIDVTSYVFHLTLPDSGARITGTATAYFRRTAPRDTLVLDLLAPMVVTRAQANGREALFAQDGGGVRVVLPPLEPRCREQVTRGAAAADTRPCVDWVTVEYGGAPTDGLIIGRDSTGRWIAFGDNWPDRARHWLPVVDHPGDKATVEWRVNAPAERTVVANGRLAEESPLPGTSRRLTVWRTDKPIPTYLMVIAAAPLARIAIGPTACGLAEAGGCVMQDVYQSADLAPTMPPAFQAAGAMVEWLGRVVGPYPYEKLAHLQSSTRFGGMENASAIFYSDRAWRRGTVGEGLVAHETAHQWFGDAVTPARWADVWLSEGFATYFAALWEERARGDSAFRVARERIRATVRGADVVRERPVIDTLAGPLMRLLNANSYQKGGFVLHMLRREIGDSAFFGGVRAYYAAHRHGTARTADLRAAVERAAGRDLGWFFAQWLTRPDMPALAVAHARDAAGRVTLTVRQQGGAWRFPLTVRVTTADGAARDVTVQVPAQAESRLVLPGAWGEVREVVLDPHADLLFREAAPRP